jgi:hypothetical protein
MFIQQLSVALGIISLIGFIASSGNQKKISAFLLGISILTGIITFSARDNQSLSPPKQSVGEEQSVGQEQQPVQNMAPIVIDHDGVYDLPDRPLKVCFTRTGDAKDLLVNKVTIGGQLYTQHDDGCQDISPEAKGNVSISLLSGQPYSDQVKEKIGMPDVNNNYEYYRRVGFGGYPTIQAR